MKFFKIILISTVAGLISFSAMAHDPKGESFSLSGKISSVELTDEENVASASANIEAPINIASPEPASNGALKPILPITSPVAQRWTPQ